MHPSLKLYLIIQALDELANALDNPRMTREFVRDKLREKAKDLRMLSRSSPPRNANLH
jgi:hypothetical protein